VNNGVDIPLPKDIHTSMCRTTYAVAERDVDWADLTCKLKELLIERELLEQEYYNYVDLQYGR
jgi:hypothetical protein